MDEKAVDENGYHTVKTFYKSREKYGLRDVLGLDLPPKESTQKVSVRDVDGAKELIPKDDATGSKSSELVVPAKPGPESGGLASNMVNSAISSVPDTPKLEAGTTIESVQNDFPADRVIKNDIGDEFSKMTTDSKNGQKRYIFTEGGADSQMGKITKIYYPELGEVKTEIETAEQFANEKISGKDCTPEILTAKVIATNEKGVIKLRTDSTSTLIEPKKPVCTPKK